MKRIHFLLVVIVWSFAGNTWAEDLLIPDDRNTIEFHTKIGVVTFLHQMHSSLTITECTTCHHKMQPEDTRVQGCHECHKKEANEEVPKSKIAFHTRCTGCHQYTIDQGNQAGPIRKKCKLCHIKPPKE